MTLSARNTLGYRLGESGAVAHAIAELESLVVDESRILGDDAPETLITRNNLSHWIAVKKSTFRNA